MAKKATTPLWVWKYPRVRGEEASNSAGTFLPTEIPPRARGRGTHAARSEGATGNTPACAGKRHPWRASVRPSQKYPRVRGEEVVMMPDGWPVAEIPPRARGRGDPKGWHPLLYGNTPACAGKSALILDRMPTPRKYPRVRGEEMVFSLFLQKPLEIPPRARGRAYWTAGKRRVIGNTPACAGKRPPSRATMRAIRKYPRVRGEEPPMRA